MCRCPGLEENWVSNLKNMENNSDAKTIAILDSYIHRVRSGGLKDVLPDCNSFGNPELNFLYLEICGCCQNGQFMLGLTGAGMFLEQFTNEIWVSEQVHKAQLRSQFNSWDEVMAFLESQYQIVESKKIAYKKDVRPVLKTILDSKDLEAIELLRDFVRNTFVHSKRIKLLGTLRKHGVIPNEIPAGKATFAEGKIVKTEEVKLSPTHPLINKIGFRAIARQLAPAVLIFIFEMFKKYHKQMAPYRDDNIKFSGHECEYD